MAPRPRPPVRTRVGAVTGAVVVLAAVCTFMAAFVASVGTPGTAYVWHTNMISDLGDRSCHTRDARWICSPAHDAFNAALVATGVLLAVAGALLRRPWGRVLAGAVAVMGLGLAVAGVFTATEHGARHLLGVVLALVAPGLGLLWSAIRPETAWLDAYRTARGLLATVALLLAAESRLPNPVVPRGAGELGIVLCLVSALALEAVRVLRARGATSRSAGGTAATASTSRSAGPRNGASARR